MDTANNTTQNTSSNSKKLGWSKSDTVWVLGLYGTAVGADITEVIEEHFGAKMGQLITILYFFAIYPILLVYSVALTNTVESFMRHQLHMTPPARPILALVLI